MAGNPFHPQPSGLSYSQDNSAKAAAAEEKLLHGFQGMTAMMANLRDSILKLVAMLPKAFVASWAAGGPHQPLAFGFRDLLTRASGGRAYGGGYRGGASGRHMSEAQFNAQADEGLPAPADDPAAYADKVTAAHRARRLLAGATALATTATLVSQLNRHPADRTDLWSGPWPREEQSNRHPNDRTDLWDGSWPRTPEEKPKQIPSYFPGMWQKPTLTSKFVNAGGELAKGFTQYFRLGSKWRDFKRGNPFALQTDEQGRQFAPASSLASMTWHHGARQAASAPFLASVAAGAGLAHSATPDALSTLFANTRLASAKAGGGMTGPLWWMTKKVHGIGSFAKENPAVADIGAKALVVTAAFTGLVLIAAKLASTLQAASMAARRFAASGGLSGLGGSPGARFAGGLGGSLAGGMIGSAIGGPISRAVGAKPGGLLDDTINWGTLLGGTVLGGWLGTKAMGSLPHGISAGRSAMGLSPSIGSMESPGAAWEAAARATSGGSKAAPGFLSKMAGTLGKIAGPAQIAITSLDMESADSAADLLLNKAGPSGNLAAAGLQASGFAGKANDAWSFMKGAANPAHRRWVEAKIGMSLNPFEWFKDKPSIAGMPPGVGSKRDPSPPLDISSRVDPMFMGIEDMWKTLQLSMLQPPVEGLIQREQLENLKKLTDYARNQDANIAKMANGPAVGQ